MNNQGKFLSTANWEHYGNRLLISFLLSNRYYKTIPMKACYFSIVLFVNASTFILSLYNWLPIFLIFVFLWKWNGLFWILFYSHTSNLIPQSEFQYSTDSRVKPHLSKEFLKKKPTFNWTPFCIRSLQLFFDKLIIRELLTPICWLFTVHNLLNVKEIKKF